MPGPRSEEPSPEGTAEKRSDTGLQPSLRDSGLGGDFPDVETPGYSRAVPPGRFDVERSIQLSLGANCSSHRFANSKPSRSSFCPACRDAGASLMSTGGVAS